MVESKIVERTGNSYYRTTYIPGYSREKMELLINNGYVPDYDDVYYGIKHKIEIPDISRFNIKLDKKMLDLCQQLNFYPVTYTFDCIDKSRFIQLSLDIIRVDIVSQQVLFIFKF